jgi:hypothetical protein
MSKQPDLSFAGIKRSIDSSMPVVPSGSNRERIGLLASGNPDVVGEATGKERGPKLKSGPAWEEGLKNCTPVRHSPGKSDGKELGRGRPITY